MINFPLIFLPVFQLIILHRLRFDQFSLDLIIDHSLNILILHFHMLLILELLHIQFLQLKQPFLLFHFLIKKLEIIRKIIIGGVRAWIPVGFGSGWNRFEIKQFSCIPRSQFAFHVLRGCPIITFWILSLLLCHFDRIFIYSPICIQLEGINLF